MDTYVNAPLLRFGAAILIGFGTVIALSAWPPASGFIGLFVDVLAWPLDGAQSLAAKETRLALAIAGGVMAGWGAMIWMATNRLVARDPAFLRSLVMVPAVIWFVVDSLGSVASGIAVNAGVNLAVLLIFVAAFVGRAQVKGA